jgi:hypothetical protein
VGEPADKRVLCHFLCRGGLPSQHQRKAEQPALVPIHHRREGLAVAMPHRADGAADDVRIVVGGNRRFVAFNSRTIGIVAERHRVC